MSPATSTFQPGKIFEDETGMEAAATSIMDLISGRDSAISVAKQFDTQASLIEAEESKDAASRYMDNIQSAVTSLAVETPAIQPPLVDLIEVLYKDPAKSFREKFFAGFFVDTGDFHSSLLSDPGETDKYININIFEARLWNRLGPSFRSQLTGDPVRNLARSIEAILPDNQSLQEVDAEVSAGCMWIIHAAQSIWALSITEEPSKGSKTWSGVLWQGRRDGFSLSRWNFWAERLDAISRGEGPEVNEQTRRYASSALRIMREIQTEGSSNNELLLFR